MRGYHTPLSHTLTLSYSYSPHAQWMCLSKWMCQPQRMCLSRWTSYSPIKQSMWADHKRDPKWTSVTILMVMGECPDGRWWHFMVIGDRGHGWEVMVIGCMSSSWMMVNERESHLWWSWSWVRSQVIRPDDHESWSWMMVGCDSHKWWVIVISHDGHKS